jgi:hypothetical protein
MFLSGIPVRRSFPEERDVYIWWFWGPSFLDIEYQCAVNYLIDSPVHVPELLM